MPAASQQTSAWLWPYTAENILYQTGQVKHGCKGHHLPRWGWAGIPQPIKGGLVFFPCSEPSSTIYTSVPDPCWAQAGQDVCRKLASLASRAQYIISFYHNTVMKSQKETT